MPRTSLPRLVRRGLIALPLLLLWGCASASEPGLAPTRQTSARPAAGTGLEVLVVLPREAPAAWTSVVGQLEVEYGLRTVAAWPMESLGQRCVLFENASDLPTAAVVRRLEGDRRVDTVQQNQIFEVRGQRREDPYANLQHAARSLRVPAAHRWATGKGIRVAVIDTGVDLTHPDLKGQVVRARNFVREDQETFTTDIHGTAVAGVIAAATGNGIGIIGVAPRAEILALKACWQRSADSRRAVCNTYTLAQAIDFAIQEGAHVLNFSLTGPPDPLLTRLVLAAAKRGIAVVAAAPEDVPAKSSFPASVEEVIAVSACDLDGNLLSPTSVDDGLTLAAPGVEILTTAPQGTYDFFSGSSLAAAHVSGVAALLLEKKPTLTPAELRSLLQQTSRTPDGTTDQAMPAPVVDACGALAKLLGVAACA